MKKALFLMIFGLVLSTQAMAADKMSIFEVFDVNKDGKISESEFIEMKTKKAQNWFDNIDLDNDDFITVEEWSSAKDKWQEKKVRKNMNN